MFRAQVVAKKYPTRRHVLRSKSFTACLRKAFSRRVFRNTDRKLLRIMSGFNIKGEENGLTERNTQKKAQISDKAKPAVMSEVL